MIDVFTDAGFNRPTFDEILAEQSVRARQLFGDDINLDGNTALGKFVRLNVYEIAKLYEVLEGVYYSNFPTTAIGASLDRLCVYKGIHRNAQTYASHKLSVTSTQGQTVPAGFLFRADNGTEFETHQEYTITGQTEILVYCAGTAGNIGAGSINTIVNPQGDLAVVASSSQLVEAGTDTESDYSLRQRFTAAASRDGYGTASAVRSAVLAVSGVRGCLIVEDEENRTFACYVSAPVSRADAIAQAIFDKKPLGILPSDASGTTYGIAVDSLGEEHEIHFYAVMDTPIYFGIIAKINAKFPADGADRIKAAIIEKIGLLGIADDVIPSSLYGSVYAIPGVEEVTGLTAGRSAASLSSVKIEMGQSEIAVTGDSYISVVTT